MIKICPWKTRIRPSSLRCHQKMTLRVKLRPVLSQITPFVKPILPFRSLILTFSQRPVSFSSSIDLSLSSPKTLLSFSSNHGNAALEPYLSCSMPHKRLRVAVLVSGGVDSSVALRLLHAAGHSCTAFYLKIWFQVTITMYYKLLQCINGCYLCTFMISCLDFFYLLIFNAVVAK